MFIVLKEGEKWRSAFRCDKCNKVIDNLDSGVALIYDEGGHYEPRSHFHRSCLPESGRAAQMPLREFVKTMLDSFPL